MSDPDVPLPENHHLGHDSALGVPLPKTPNRDFDQEVIAALQTAFARAKELQDAAFEIEKAANDFLNGDPNQLTQADLLALRDKVNSLPSMQDAWQSLHDGAQAARLRTEAQQTIVLQSASSVGGSGYSPRTAS